MDGKKLKAFAEKGGGPPKHMDPPPAKKKGKPGKIPPKDAGTGNDDDFQEAGDGKYGALLEMLEHNYKEIEEMIDECDPEMLDDPHSEIDEETTGVIKDHIASFDEDMRTELENLSGITPKDAAKLSDHLDKEGMLEEPDKFTGWLVRVGEVLAGGPAEDDEDEDEPKKKGKKKPDDDGDDDFDEDEDQEF